MTMSHTLHVFDYLASPQQHKPTGICAVFGDEPFLKRLALGELKRHLFGDEGDASPTVYDCEDRIPDWRDVADELATGSLFGGGGPRVVLLERADAFVTAQRSRLEDFAAKPKHTGLLILDVSTWAANTNLYKAVDAIGLQIECKPPQKAKGKTGKELDEVAVAKWVVDWGRQQHGLSLSREAAEHLVSLSGPVFGVLDMDLAKLALFAVSGQKVAPDLVQDVVGGWRSRSSFDMVDAAAAGNADQALQQLDRLLQAGEHPLAVFGAISWSLRRYAAATRIYQQSERVGQRVSLKEALSKAGVRDYPFGELAKVEDRMKQIGRVRGGKLYEWLMELDLSLKGTHSSDSRARFALEQLFLRMAKGAILAATPAAGRR